MARLWFYVKCDRCGTFAEADHKEAPREPVGWTIRTVIGPWSLGSPPDSILLCRGCTEAVDKAMGRAWSDAIAPPPTPAPKSPPREEQEGPPLHVGAPQVVKPIKEPPR